jgi:hypothetical protein
LAVLFDEVVPMTIRDVHAEVEARLGRPVSYSSIKNAMARLASPLSRLPSRAVSSIYLHERTPGRARFVQAG